MSDCCSQKKKGGVGIYFKTKKSIAKREKLLIHWDCYSEKLIRLNFFSSEKGVCVLKWIAARKNHGKFDFGTSVSIWTLNWITQVLVYEYFDTESIGS